MLLPVRLHIVRNAGVRLVTTNQRREATKSESEEPTVRNRLHNKFSLDLSGSLHDLTKARENVIILRGIKNTPDLGDARDIH